MTPGALSCAFVSLGTQRFKAIVRTLNIVWCGLAGRTAEVTNRLQNAQPLPQLAVVSLPPNATQQGLAPTQQRTVPSGVSINWSAGPSTGWKAPKPGKFQSMAAAGTVHEVTLAASGRLAGMFSYRMHIQLVIITCRYFTWPCRLRMEAMHFALIRQAYFLMQERLRRAQAGTRHGLGRSSAKQPCGSSFAHYTPDSVEILRAD